MKYPHGQKKSPGRSATTTTTTTSQNDTSIDGNNFDNDKQIQRSIVNDSLDKRDIRDRLSSPDIVNDTIDMTNSVLDMNNNDLASETKERESDHEDSGSSIRREGTFDKTSTVDEHDDDKTGNSFLDTINQKFDNMVSEEPDKIDDSLDMSHTKVDTEKKKRMKKSKAFGSSFEKALSRNERSNTITSETQSSVIVEDKNETQEQQIDKVVNIETKKHRKSIKQTDNICLLYTSPSPRDRG